MVTLPSRALWLRLLVTALLCVAGIARPVASSGDSNGVRLGEPMHVSTPGRAAELSRFRASRADDASGEADGILDDALRLHLASRSCATRSSRHVEPSSAIHDFARARGPPLA
jgi:hypothetical protein